MTQEKEMVSTQHNRVMAVAVAVAVAVALFAVWLYRNSLSQTAPGCSVLNFYVHGVINLVMHVALFSLFVCIFFFTVVHEVEQRTVYLNIQRVMNEIMDEVETLSNQPVDLSGFATSITAMAATPEMKEADDNVKAGNAALRDKAFRLFGTILAAGLAFSGLLWGVMYAYARGKKGSNIKAGCDYPHMGHILKHNAVILLFVLLTELFFLYGVTLHFNSLDDNFVKHLFIQKLLDHIPDSSPGWAAAGAQALAQTESAQAAAARRVRRLLGGGGGGLA